MKNKIVKYNIFNQVIGPFSVECTNRKSIKETTENRNYGYGYCGEAERIEDRMMDFIDIKCRSTQVEYDGAEPLQLLIVVPCETFLF